MLLRRHQGGPRVRAVHALSAVAVLAAASYACDGDRVVVRSDRTRTSAASRDTGSEPEGECGDAIVGAGEECEPPGTTTCNEQCLRVVSGCGNGVLDPYEECEDGNALSG